MLFFILLSIVRPSAQVFSNGRVPAEADCPECCDHRRRSCRVDDSEVCAVHVAIYKSLTDESRYLKAEQCFDEITLFERQSAPGGIWNYVEGANNGTPNGHHPSNGLLAGLGTPIYRDLECNAPFEMMQFSDQPLPSGQPLFPPRSSIQEYLVEYAKDVLPMIKFNCEVLTAKPVPKPGTKAWEVISKSLSTGQTNSRVYDGLIVASGRQAIPRYPQLSGVQEWFKQHPGTISHSAQFDVPDPFSSKVTISLAAFNRELTNGRKSC